MLRNNGKEVIHTEGQGLYMQFHFKNDEII